MDEFARELSDKLGEIYRNVTRIEERALREGNIHLSISEMHLVSILNKHKEGITVGEVATLMDVARPTATVAVTRLVSKGYAVKQSGERDGRMVRVYPTEEGKKIYTLHKRCQRCVITKLGDEFTAEQRNVLLKAINKLNIYFQKDSLKEGKHEI